MAKTDTTRKATAARRSTGDTDGVAQPRARKSARKPRLPKDVAAAVTAALDKKAFDVVVLDLRKSDGFTDYFVICSGANSRQIGAIAEAVEDTLRRDFDTRPVLAEGRGKSEWILRDYFDFVVHVFTRDCRAFYDLERLWGKAERYEFGGDEEHSAVGSGR